jgi:hypothetical protein
MAASIDRQCGRAARGRHRPDAHGIIARLPGRVVAT